MLISLFLLKTILFVSVSVRVTGYCIVLNRYKILKKITLNISLNLILSKETNKSSYSVCVGRRHFVVTDTDICAQFCCLADKREQIEALTLYAGCFHFAVDYFL